MRNLKRVLSLSLASIMLLGMMVIGSSAAQDYTDVDYSSDNVEAIEVLDAINVMRGDLDNDGNLAGTFRPGDEVKRSEMARIMAFLMDLDYDYYIGANPFNDMVGHWAEKYAAACAATGIIYGRGNGIYDPDATVTAVEAASMLLRALGYFQNPAVDQPNGFVIDTIRQAGRINLFNKVDVKTDEPMTRNDVAQLVLNALQSGMVEPSTSLSVTTPDGFTVSTGGTNYVYRVARNDDIGKAINETKASEGNANDGLMGFVLDLGEQLYQGSLKLNDDIDVYGRPARTWEFDGAKVGTYVKDEQLRYVYTGKVTGRDLVDLLTASTIEKYDPIISVDGIRAVPENQAILNAGSGSLPYFTKGNLIRANTDAVGATARGVRTEVYVDSLNAVYYIAIINTYLAKATEDYNDRTEDVDFELYGIRDMSTTSVPVLVKDTSRVSDLDRSPVYKERLTVENEDIYVEDVKKDDIFLAHVADGEIQELIIPNVVSDTVISSFQREEWVDNGDKYNYANTALYDWEVLDQYDQINMKDVTYNIILDEYDNLIGLERNENPNQYVFITGIESGNSDLGNRNADMNAIFLDGTMATIKVDLTKSDNTVRNVFPGMGAIVNTWCTYRVDSGDVYTLNVVPLYTHSATGVQTSKVAQWAQNVADGMIEDAPATNAGTAGYYGTTGNAAINADSTNNKSDNKDPNDASYTIDKGHISLLGNPNALGSDTHRYNRVYGTDETVYINAKLSLINLATGKQAPDDDNTSKAATTILVGNGLGKGFGNRGVVDGGTSTAALTAAPTTTSLTDNSAALTTSDWNYVSPAGSGNLVAIINDVDTVTVGVRNTDTKVYDLHMSNDTNGGLLSANVVENVGNAAAFAYPKSEIYTLYNKDGDIIAAVTLGEEQGTSTKLAYFHTSKLEREAYPNNDTSRAAGDDWYWTRKAIIDGEEVLLTEVGSNLRMIGTAANQGNIQKGDWAEVRFDADGNVRKVTEIAYTGSQDGSPYPVANNAKGKYINNAQYLEDSLEDFKTVLLRENLVGTTGGNNPTPTRKVYVESGSLWIQTATLTGVSVAKDVKTIVFLSKLGNSDTVGNVGLSNSHDKMSRVYEGIDGLTSAIANLDNNFSGYLSIVAEDEQATVIILDDRWGTKVNQGSSNTPPVTGLDKKTTLEYVQELLDDGQPVEIDGDWMPDDLEGGKAFLRIDDPVSLKINGNFNLLGQKNNTTIVISGDGGLTVTKKLYATNDNFEYNEIELDALTVGDMDLDIKGADPFTVSGTVVTSGTGTIRLTNSGDAGSVEVKGTLGSRTAGTTENVGTGVTVKITNTDSMHGAKLTGEGTVEVGSETEPGKIDIPTIALNRAAGGTLVFINVGSTPTEIADNVNITTVTSGIIDNQTSEQITIPIVKEDVTLESTADNGGTFLVTEELGTTDIDDSVTPGENVKITGDAAGSIGKAAAQAAGYRVVGDAVTVEVDSAKTTATITVNATALAALEPSTWASSGVSDWPDVSGEGTDSRLCIPIDIIAPEGATVSELLSVTVAGTGAAPEDESEWDDETDDVTKDSNTENAYHWKDDEGILHDWISVGKYNSGFEYDETNGSVARTIYYKVTWTIGATGENDGVNITVTYKVVVKFTNVPETPDLGDD